MASLEVEQVIQVDDNPKLLIPVDDSNRPCKGNDCWRFLSLLAIISLKRLIACSIIVVCGAIMYFLFTILDGETTRPSNPEFRIQSAALINSSTTSTTSDDEFTGTWDLKLVAISPNESIQYDILQASLLCHVKGDLYVELASTSLRPFFLPANNQTTISFQQSVTGGYVGRDAAWEILSGNRKALSLSVSGVYRYTTMADKLKDPIPIMHFYDNFPI